MLPQSILRSEVSFLAFLKSAWAAVEISSVAVSILVFALWLWVSDPFHFSCSKHTCSLTRGFLILIFLLCCCSPCRLRKPEAAAWCLQKERLFFLISVSLVSKLTEHVLHFYVYENLCLFQTGYSRVLQVFDEAPDLGRVKSGHGIVGTGKFSLNLRFSQEEWMNWMTFSIDFSIFAQFIT